MQKNIYIAIIPMPLSVPCSVKNRSGVAPGPPAQPRSGVSVFSFVGNYFTTTFLTTEVLSVTTFTRYTPVGSCISAFPKIFNPLL